MNEELNFAEAERIAKKTIEEEPLIVFPDKYKTNLSKCYMELQERYDIALAMIDSMELLYELYAIKHDKSSEEEEILRKIREFKGQDWDIRVMKGMRNYGERKL